MLSIYPACFITEKNNVSVVFPDWNYTATCGKDFAEAMTMAVDCLAGLIYMKKLEGKKLPNPTDMDKVNIKAVCEYAECTPKNVMLNAVSVDADIYAEQNFEKCVKKTVTIYEWQNREGIRRGINFSKIFQEALTKALIN